MTKKNWLLILLALGLGTLYVIYFTDWLQPKTVRIFHTSRNLRRRAPAANALPAIIFGLNRQIRLTEIKVVLLDAWQTNHNVLPAWHLVTSSNSAPVKTFFYGQRIAGLKPAVPGARPEPLQTNVLYRLFVTAAGNIHGQHDFETGTGPKEAK